MELKYLPLILLLPLILAFVAKHFFKETITNAEMTLHIFVGIIISFVVFELTVFSANYDVYYAHGIVTAKVKNRVSCSHSNRICTGAGKNQTCITTYDHPFDIEYYVDSTVGRTEISSPDRQGLIEPSRWKAAQIGEHYATTFSFQNYLKNSEYSIMNKKYENIKERINSKPHIYDLYRLDPVSEFGVRNINIAPLNQHLKDLLKHRGHTFNINILFVEMAPADFKYVVLKNWQPVLNDILVVISIKDNKVEWSEALMYADSIRNEILVTDIRLDLPGKGIDTNLIDEIVALSDAKYHHMSGDEFKRLQFEMELSTLQIVFIIVFNLICNFAITVYLHKNNVV